MNEQVMWVIIGICVGVLIGMKLHVFAKKDKQEKIAAVSTWLLYAVTLAEQKWGAGTGKIKLAEVYDMFLTKFPNLMTLIPYSDFVDLVSEALDNMKHILNTNKQVADIVIGATPTTEEEILEAGDADKGE